MQGMVSQRLLRRICPNCREAYTPSEDELRELGMEGQEGVQLYRGTGCPHCFDTGYRGRTAVTETLIMTPTLRRLVAEGKRLPPDRRGHHHRGGSAARDL